MIKLEGSIRSSVGEECRLIHLRKALWRANDPGPSSHLAGITTTGRGSFDRVRTMRFRRRHATSPIQDTPPSSPSMTISPPSTNPGLRNEDDLVRGPGAESTDPSSLTISTSATSGVSKVLEAGRHHWPFRFHFPSISSTEDPMGWHSPLPSSFTGDGISVCYSIVAAQIGMAGGKKGIKQHISSVTSSTHLTTTTLPITYLSHVPLNTSELQCSWKETRGLGEMGEVEVQVDRRGWEIGRELPINLTLPPQVKSVRAQLVKTITYFTDIQVQMQSKVLHQAMALAPSQGPLTLNLSIPSEAPPTVTQAATLRISYHARIRVQRDTSSGWKWGKFPTLPSRGSKATINIPLVLGLPEESMGSSGFGYGGDVLMMSGLGEEDILPKYCEVPDALQEEMIEGMGREVVEEAPPYTPSMFG